LRTWNKIARRKEKLMRTRIWYVGVVGALAGIVCALAASAGAQTRANGEAVVSGYAPKQAMAGQVVTISGLNLDGTLSVAFGKAGSPSIAVDPNGTSVRAVVPVGVAPGAVYITLDNNGNPASIGGFVILSGSVPPGNPAYPQATAGAAKTGAASSAQTAGKLKLAPRITGFSPSRGSVGMSVTITGANLGGALWLKFGGVRAHISRSSASTIIGLVPKLAHSGKISVHTTGGTGVSSQRFVVA
jgi:hypothetical protein